MVKAILEGRKTQTRRTLKQQAIRIHPTEGWPGSSTGEVKCPYGKRGDVLWVRETWRVISWDFEDQEETIVQYADGTKRKVCLHEDSEKNSDFLLKLLDKMQTKCEPTINEEQEHISWSAEQVDKFMPWKPSIHMPKAAARIWLEITNVRVERLQDITDSDSMAEGICEYNDGTFKNYFTQRGLRTKDGVECLLPKGSFSSLWTAINGLNSWDTNPWVWVIEFKRIEKPKA